MLRVLKQKVKIMLEKISSLVQRNKIIRFGQKDDRGNTKDAEIHLFYGLWLITYNSVILADTISDLLQAYYLLKGNVRI